MAALRSRRKRIREVLGREEQGGAEREGSLPRLSCSQEGEGDGGDRRASDHSAGLGKSQAGRVGPAHGEPMRGHCFLQEGRALVPAVPSLPGAAPGCGMQVPLPPAGLGGRPEWCTCGAPTRPCAAAFHPQDRAGPSSPLPPPPGALPPWRHCPLDLAARCRKGSVRHHCRTS